MTLNEQGQYYTKSEVVKYLLNVTQTIIDFEQIETVCEPSAGTGEFYYELIKNFKVTALDTHPKFRECINQDFFIHENRYDAIIGNPPFGKNSSLALKFLNKSLQLANVVCFILPKTFKKKQIQNKVDAFAHLIYEQNLSKNSFYLDKIKSYDVPCCWQIWVKTPVKRNTVIKSEKHNEFLELTDFENKDISIRRAGSKAGLLIKNKEKHVDGIFYFKVKDKIVLEILNNKTYQVKIQEIASYTAGTKSISLNELITTIRACFYKFQNKE